MNLRCRVMDHRWREPVRGILVCSRCDAEYCGWCDNNPINRGKHHWCHVYSAHARQPILKTQEIP